MSVGDFGVVETNFGHVDHVPEQGDLTGDGVVSGGDIGVISTNFGRAISVGFAN